MKLNEVIDFVKKELIYEAKSDIVNRFNAKDEMIVDDFSYVVDGHVEYRSKYALVDDDLIIRYLYNNMLNLCITAIPVSLLVLKGQGSEIARNFNKEFDIRKPKKPNKDEALDIDEPLAIASMYYTLADIGLSRYNTMAKELINEYNKNIVIPNANEADTLAFRFSIDGNSWHDSYQEGDSYFGIYQRRSWGKPIPLIGGNSGGGAKSFLELSDTPTSFEKGKYLKSSDNGLVWAEINNSGGSSGTAPANTLSDINGDFADGVDFTTQSAFIKIALKTNWTFKIKQSSSFSDLITPNKEYKIFVLLNGHTLTFPASSMAILDNTGKAEESNKAISGNHYVVFNVMQVDNGIVIYGISRT